MSRARGHAVRHDAEDRRRKGEADRDLVEPDPRARVGRGDAVIARERDHAPAGDRVTVRARHGRRGVIEDAHHRGARRGRRSARRPLRRARRPPSDRAPPRARRPHRRSERRRRRLRRAARGWTPSSACRARSCRGRRARDRRIRRGAWPRTEVRVPERSTVRGHLDDPGRVRPILEPCATSTRCCACATSMPRSTSS